MGTSSKKLIIAEYSEYPGPRYCNQGDCSGEDFYHNKLNPAFAEACQTNTILTVDLDGTAGYASSFLDEAFGNLIFDFTLENVKSKIHIISKQEPDWIQMIENEVFIDWETRRINNEKPKKTGKHEEWYRLENGMVNKKIWI